MGKSSEPEFRKLQLHNYTLNMRLFKCHAIEHIIILKNNNKKQSKNYFNKLTMEFANGQKPYYHVNLTDFIVDRSEKEKKKTTIAIYLKGRDYNRFLIGFTNQCNYYSKPDLKFSFER